MPWPVSTGRSLTQCSQPVLLSVRPSVRSFCDYDISKTDELIVLQIGTGTPRGNEIKWWTFVARDHRINPWKGPSLCFFLFWNLCRLKEMMSSAWIVCSLRLFHLLTTRSEKKWSAVVSIALALPSCCYRFQATGCWRISWPWNLRYGSLKMVLFESLGTVSYSHSIVTMSVS